jgi:hypothetical protein
VLGLDSEGLSDTSKLERERAFIRSKLAANNGVPTIVMWHRPRFSQGEHGDQTDAGVQMLWDETTSDSDVKLAIWGHDHNFEQQTRRGNGGQDVTTIVTGTGGAELRNCPGQADPTIDTNTVAPGAIGPTGALVCGSASATFRNYGVVSLSLTMSGFSWQYRQVDPILVTGRVIASGTRAL